VSIVMETAAEDRIPCPSCGGAGGGPFGRAGSAWDDEAWVCPRCKGAGWVAPDDVMLRPGLAKAPLSPAADDAKKRKATG
jgi:hypothetical protein